MNCTTDSKEMRRILFSDKLEGIYEKFDYIDVCVLFINKVYIII